MTTDQLAEFSDFYSASKDACLRAVLASMPNAAEPDDLVAEAFSRAFGQWASVRSHPAPRAWVLRTALNLHRDEWRKRSRPLRLVRDGSADDAVDEPSRRLDPMLVRALDQLSDRQRQIIVLRVLLGLSTAQTATEVGIDASTVPVHLSRALSSLRTSPLIKEYLDVSA